MPLSAGRPLGRAIVVWFVLIAAEFLHGIARALWLVPLIGDFRARQIGVFTGSIINLAVAAAFIDWIHPPRAGIAILVGVMWLALTLVFEIVFGRLVMHATWERLGSDYNVLSGGLLPFGLFVLLCTPLLTARFRRVF
jgi:hypothetical protein